MKRVVGIAIVLLAGAATIFAALYIYAITMDKRITYDAKKDDPNPVIDLSKYIIIRTEGTDGVGEAKAALSAGYYTDYNIHYVGDSKAMEEKYGVNALVYLDRSIEIKLVPSEGLSNGDEIKYRIIIHNDCEEVLNCSFEGLKGTYTVSGLEESIIGAGK